MSDGLQIPEHLWKALELMEQEMGVPKHNLICQAIFMLARLNGYLVEGKALAEPAHIPAPRPSTQSRQEAFEPAPSRETFEPPPARREELIPTPPPSPPPPREETPARRRPPAPPLPPYEEEEEEALPPEELPYAEHESTREAAHAQAYVEEAYEGAYEEAAPLTLAAELPGEEPVYMEAEEFLIGRGKDCDFIIDSNRVSRQHARITREGNSFMLEDLKSSNGTFFGKHREKVSSREVVDGDEFVFGTERVIFSIR